MCEPNIGTILWMVGTTGLLMAIFFRGIKAMSKPECGCVHTTSKRIEELEALLREVQDINVKMTYQQAELLDEHAKLRRDIDNIKVRSYELGQRELHDMALAALLKGEKNGD